jgi:hypothetical protein
MAITTRPRTMSATPRNIVQCGARIASNAAVASQAQRNANVATTGRARVDILGLASAAPNAHRMSTS